MASDPSTLLTLVGAASGVCSAGAYAVHRVLAGKLIGEGLQATFSDTSEQPLTDDMDALLRRLDMPAEGQPLARD